MRKKRILSLRTVEKMIAILLVMAMLAMDIPSEFLLSMSRVNAAELETKAQEEATTEEPKERESETGTEQTEPQSGQDEAMQAENGQTAENELTEEEETTEKAASQTKEEGEPVSLEGTHIVGEEESLRDEYSKTFQRDDGLYTTVMYAAPLHYLDETTEEWVEIDNTLKEETDEDGESYYTNMANDFDVSLPETLSEGEEVRISQGEYSVSFVLEGTDSREAQVTDDDSALRDGLLAQMETEEHMKTPEITEDNDAVPEEDLSEEEADSRAMEEVVESMPLESGIVYEDVYEQTDLIYNLQGKSLKESILLSEAPKESRIYSYLIQTDGLKAVLNEDQSISFKSKNETIFKMPAPYMYDADHQASYDIKMSLREASGGYRLTYEPDLDWLTDEGRVYPVTIDPTLESTRTSAGIADAYVSSENPAVNYGSSTLLALGKTSSGVVSDIYLKINSLPYTGMGTKTMAVTNAKLKLTAFQRAEVGTSVYQVKSYWSESSITYNQRPSCDTNALDYWGEYMGYYAVAAYDITSLASGWYEGTVSNYGVMITCSSTDIARFFSSESSANYCPSLEITYKSLLGTGAGGSHKSIDMGKSGMVYLDDYSGNACIVRDDIGMDGNVMPVQISMAYNSLVADGGAYGLGTSCWQGFGWKVNYQQKLNYVTHTVGNETREYYEYLSDTGTRIYFDKQQGATDADKIFVDSGGSGYTLTVDMSDLSDFTLQKLTDADGNTCYFDSYGRLKKIVGDYPATRSVTATSNLSPLRNEPGVIRIDYKDESAMLQISAITDGAGRQYTFHYKDSSYLDYIQLYSSGNTQTVSYEYEYLGTELLRLVNVSYNGEQKAGYTHNSGYTAVINGLVNPDGSRMWLSGANGVGKVKAIRLYGTDGAIYQDITVTRTAGQTKYVDGVTGNTEILQFDPQGNVTCVQDGKGYAVFGGYTKDSGNHNILANMSEEFKSANNLIKFTDLITESGCVTGDEVSRFDLGRSIKIPPQKLPAISYVSGELEPGVYTFSTYVKGSGISFGMSGTGTEIINRSSSFGRENTWTRLFQTIRLSKKTKVSIAIGNYSATPGWCDGIQIERGELGEYNMVENGDFNHAIGSGWVQFGASSGIASGTDTGKASPVSGDYISVIGDVASERGLRQTVPISGKKGDEYSFGAYAMALALPNKDGRNRAFNIQAKVIRAAGVDPGEHSEDKVYSVNFNAYSTDWQYALDGFTTEYAYSGIEISIHYDYQLNMAYFDAIQLYKVPFATNSVFNADGSLNYTYDVEKNTNTDNSEVNDSDGSEEQEDDETKDSYGRVISSKTKEGITNTTTYDDFNNILSTGSTNGSTVIKAESTYTSNGNYLASQTDEAGNTTKYNYDAQLGLLKSVEDANKGLVGYTYDSAMRLTGVNQNVSGLFNGTTMSNQYSYDAGDNLSSITRNGFNYEFQYNPLGALKKAITPIGDMISYDYSSLAEGNTLDNVSYGNSQSIQYEYSDNGVLNTVNSDGATLYKYYYDVKGNGVAKMDFVNNIQTTSTMDEDGNKITTQTGINGNTLQNKYFTIENNENRETTQTQTYYGKTYKTIQNKDKDDRHKKTSWDVSNYRFAEYVYYDNLNRPDSKIFSSCYIIDGLPTRYIIQLLEQKYTYADVRQGQTSDKISQISLSNSSGYNRILNYEYNNRGYISNANGTTYTYDQAGQLTRVDNPSGGTTTYQYDKGGNLVYEKIYAYTKGTLGTPIDTITYGYHSQWKDLLISYNGADITYDAIGNPLNYYNGATFTWKMGRQLAGVTYNGRTTSYKYDDDGLRTEKTALGSAINYVYMDGVLTIQSSSDHFFYFHYDSDIELTGFDYSDRGGSGTYYYVKNLQGDIISILDSSGMEVVSYEYDEWGKLLNTSGSKASTVGKLNPFRYRGYQYDEETGFYYLKSRYYDPCTGRFLNTDVHFDIQTDILGTNMFAYCYNNPVNMVDQDGEEPIYYTMLGILFIIISVYATYVTIKYLTSFYTRWNSVISFDTYSLGRTLNGIAGTAYRIAQKARDVAAGIKASFAKVKTLARPKYRTLRERHHVVAKGDHRVKEVRDILSDVGINYKTSSQNLIWLKTGLHRRVHTNRYYAMVNQMVINASKKGEKDGKTRRHIRSTLLYIKVFLRAMNKVSPY